MPLKQRLLLLLTPLVLIPFTILGAGLLYISEVQEVFSSFDETLLKIVISVFFLVIVGIALMVIRWTAHAISTPIQKAVSYVARIARGERGISIVVEDAQGEVADLIDNLKQLQADLVKYDLELQQKTEAESMFRVASQVAHDIRSPLSALQLAANLLQNQAASSEDRKNALNLLQLSSDRLQKIADGLLAKYKGVQSEAEMFSIHELLDVLVGEIQATPLGTGVKFEKRYWSSAIHMKGDYAIIQRAIYNIIKNGIEAMRMCTDDRNMTLILRTEKHKTTLDVQITDNGMGIDPAKISSILGACRFNHIFSQAPILS
jgi:nitrogen-specific signal transduction histidine kinase